MKFGPYGDPIYPGQPGYASEDHVSRRYEWTRRDPLPEPIVLEPDWCWACGRDARQMPADWYAPWYMQHAHLSAGSGRMKRVHDRRAVALLCPRCHSMHTHHGAGVRTLQVATLPLELVQVPELSDANVLWLKRHFDPAYYDLEALATWWLGAVPEPEPLPEWYENEYTRRRGAR